MPDEQLNEWAQKVGGGKVYLPVCTSFHRNLETALKFSKCYEQQNNMGRSVLFLVLV